MPSAFSKCRSAKKWLIWCSPETSIRVPIKYPDRLNLRSNSANGSFRLRASSSFDRDDLKILVTVVWILFTYVTSHYAQLGSCYLVLSVRAGSRGGQPGPLPKAPKQGSQKLWKKEKRMPGGTKRPSCPVHRNP